MFGAVAVDMHQIVVRDLPQAPAQFARHGRTVELGVVVHDRLDRVDVMADQFRRHFFEIGRVLDDAAQAVGGRARGRVAEGGGIALDIMGGAKQFFAGLAGEASLRRLACAAESRLASADIQFPNSPDSPASAFSARATGSSRSFSRRAAARCAAGWAG